MKNYIKHHPWKIIEEGFHADYAMVSESIFSLGNGRMGHRANFEENYSGESLQGSYLGGIYYPDKTRVGWWKNGYPEYFAKVLNSVDWINIGIILNGEILDLNRAEIQSFTRELDMQHGILFRQFTVVLQNGIQLKAQFRRICSLNDKNLGLIDVKLEVDQDCNIVIESGLNGDVRNQDANYDEMFWNSHGTGHEASKAWIHQSTRKTGFEIVAATTTRVQHEQNQVVGVNTSADLSAGHRFSFSAQSGKEISVQKYVAITSSFHCSKEMLKKEAFHTLDQSLDIQQAELFNRHAALWLEKWKESDIIIEGDIAAQQAIRFNIFQLYQTYTGEDPRLNIGPKGFTGEKYGGSTYWDTEAYCLPFYMSTASEQVAQNLLLYRYHHLGKAIDNAEKLGFKDGAALYPMVTMNGEECHNEWEITFEEIHRNGAIAYAIFDYIRYTGDAEYMGKYGLEVLIGIARFWAQRLNWSKSKNQYVILGVTGPNEFENNVNNNWYTNKLAAWCMRYTAEEIEKLQQQNMEAYNRVVTRCRVKDSEISDWETKSSEMFFPYDADLDIFLQQDGFLDKEIIPVSELNPSERPIVEHWSWDRILRSCYIKQADVLQGMYFFEDEFDHDTLRRHYDFYEPLTVHESSLSPCVHSILAARLGDEQRAYEFYLRTSRLDLDDYNNDTRDGCHITSMAGTWMSITRGFAAMKVENDLLSFSPFIPGAWNSYSFKVRFRQNLLEVMVTQDVIEVMNLSGPALDIRIYDQSYHLKQDITIHRNQTTH